MTKYLLNSADKQTYPITLKILLGVLFISKFNTSGVNKRVSVVLLFNHHLSTNYISTHWRYSFYHMYV